MLTGERSLSQPSPDLPSYYPSSCAVDPVTGDLAVTNLGYGDYGSRTANLVIFKHAKGKPKPYVISSIYYYYECGYDSGGNLVINGSSRLGVVAYAIMKHGKTSLQTLTLDQDLKFPGGIQWDGEHWAIGDQNSTIYQIEIKGDKGSTVGTTKLDLDDAVYQFAIFGDRIVAPEYSTGQAQVFKYPKGGPALATISKLHLPQGVAISRGT
jgi:hypothetical protein